MPGPYDYTINIPQPPAQNFLQSLSGIMQIRNMQDQAAIAQQQAEFQKQMQPLQLDVERARLGQIGQATATSAEALRQGKITFEQAQQDRVRQLEQQAIAQAQQREVVGKFTSLPPNAPMSEIVPIANQLLMLPGGEKISKQAMENFDALQQEFQKASKTALVTATTQLQAGDIKGAKETYGLFEEAVRNSGGNNPQLKQLADGMKAQKMLLDLPDNKGVNSAKLAAVQMLSIIDPKVADSVIGAENTQANIEETKAKALKEQWAAVKLSQEIENGKPMTRSASQISDASTAASQSYSNIVETAQSLRDELKNLMAKGPVSSGMMARGEEFWKKLGADTQDAKSNYLTGFDRLVTSDLFKSLKDSTRGSMNVQELKTVGGTVPGKFDNPQRQAEYLDALISAFDRKAQLESDKANFVSTFGTNGKAPKDGEVSGIPVAKGTTLNDFLAQRKKDLGGIKVFGGAPTPAPTKTDQITGTPDLQSLLNKYR